MGSMADEIPVEDGNEITVLVTGFGECVYLFICFKNAVDPFRAQYPINPSWEIARQLPPFLPPLPETSPSSQLSLLKPPPVRILVHPSAIRVSYTTVRTLVPSLWKNKKIDYMIHIGMASGRKFHSIERRGHRDGYYMKDVDNHYLNDDSRRAAEGKHWIWDGLPTELLSSIDVDDVWKRWRVNMSGEGKGETDLRLSEDAGRYLCDFIYYSSLAELERRGEEKRVLFFHVPVEADKESVKKGVDVTLELIRAMVVSGMMKKINAEVATTEVKSEELR